MDYEGIPKSDEIHSFVSFQEIVAENATVTVNAMKL